MLDPFETGEVTGKARVNDVGYFRGTIYNGTPCRITRIVYRLLEVSGRDTPGRSFSDVMSILSRTTGDVTFNAGVLDESFAGWSIDSVEASCPNQLPSKNP